MLKKQSRLTTAEFDQFFKSGRRYHSPLMTLVYSPHHRFHGAVVVGKKVSKKAVVRNRLRRRLYSLLYHWQQSEQQTGVFMVLTKPAALDCDFKELKNTLQKLLAQVADQKR